MELAALKNILKDKVRLAYIVSFAALAIFAYLLLVKIDIGNFYKLRRSLEEANTNLNTLKTIAGYRTYINEFNSKFAVIEKDANWLIGIITGVAKEKSVPLDLVKPLEGVVSSGYKKISVLVEGRAPYHDMANFISGLENNEKYLVIEEFELKAEDVGPFRERGALRSGPPFPSGGSREREAGFPEPPFPMGGMEGMGVPGPFSPVAPEEIRAEGAPFRTERMAVFKVTVTCFRVQR